MAPEGDLKIPLQRSMDLDGGPCTLISLKIAGAEQLAIMIRNDKLWPMDAGKRTYGKLIDLNTHDPDKKPIVFNAETFKIILQTPVYRFALATVISPTLSEESGTLSADLVSAVAQLQKGGILYLLETKGKDTRSAWREEAMEEVGLIDRRILTGHPDYLLWRGRMPKERRTSTVDLIDMWANSDKPWRRTRLHDLAVQVKKMWGEQRYTVVSWGVIESRLRASKNSHFDYQALKNGRGVRLRAVCGCEWDIDVNGDPKQASSCGVDGCFGATTPPDSAKLIEKMHTYGPNVELSRQCGCGAHLIEDTQILRTLTSGKNLEVQVEIRCPHDGLVEGWAKTRIIPSSQYHK